MACDPEFVRASIEAQDAIFAAELRTDFAQWSRMPSAQMMASVTAWRKLGPSRAQQANDQRLTAYYRETGREALLPEHLRAAKCHDAFEEWKKISIQLQVSSNDLFGGLVPSQRIKDKQAKEALEATLRQKGIEFESCVKPLFRTKAGCLVYLDIMQRNHLVDAQLICCRDETRVPLARHCGLHTIITECNAPTLTASPDALNLVADEVVRHVAVLREKLV